MHGMLARAALNPPGEDWIFIDFFCNL